jgi:hypothetical protein
MKKVILLVLLSVITMTFLTAQSNKKKVDPLGTWKYEAPSAPEGYLSGTIVVGMAEKKHTVTISFAGSDYKLPAENVKVENDVILFSVYIESEDIKITLKMEGATKMSGKAVYSEGEIPLSLTKTVEAAGTK